MAYMVRDLNISERGPSQWKIILHQIYPRGIFHTAMSDRGCSQESSLVSSAVRGGDHSERVASSTTPSSAMLCVVNGPGKVQAAHVVPTYHALC